MLEFLRRTDGTERRCLSINRSRYFATMSGVLKLVASNSNCGLQARLSYACTTGYRAPSTQTRKHSLPAHRTDIQHKNTEQTAGAVAARRYGMRWRWGPDRGWREVESGGDKQVAPPVPGSSHTRKRVERRSHGRRAGDLRSSSDLGPANWGSQTSWCTGEARRDRCATFRVRPVCLASWAYRDGPRPRRGTSGSELLAKSGPVTNRCQSIRPCVQADVTPPTTECGRSRGSPPPPP